MKLLESSEELGPVAKKVVRAIAAAQEARVVDLRAFREGTARAAELQTTVASRDDLADYHPAHAAYTYVQNQVSVLSEQLTALPETRKFAQRIAAAEDEYQPSGPPMSPLTTSYFTCWAFFDASVGLRRETLREHHASGRGSSGSSSPWKNPRPTPRGRWWQTNAAWDVPCVAHETGFVGSLLRRVCTAFRMPCGAGSPPPPRPATWSDSNPPGARLKARSLFTNAVGS